MHKDKANNLKHLRILRMMESKNNHLVTRKESLTTKGSKD